MTEHRDGTHRGGDPDDRSSGRPQRRAWRRVAALAAVALLVVAAASACVYPDDEADTAEEVPTGTGPDQPFPDVVDVQVTPEGGDQYTFAVTLSSPYDTADRFASGWRVLDGDEELGTHVLIHDHADEQPFTRSDTITVPEGVDEVTVEGKDSVNGWGGGTMAVTIPTS